MFGAPLATSQQAWLIGLFAIWFVLLFGGFALGKPTQRRDRRMPAWTRLGSSGVLVVASVSWLHIASSTPAALFAVLIALGMALGFVGDLLLAGLLPVSRQVAAGMVAFGLGHVSYILAFSGLGARYLPYSPVWRTGIWIGWVLVGTAVWWGVVFRASRQTRMRWAALPYTILLATTAAVTTCLALQDPGFVLAAAGATLFLVSDSILAANLFGNWQFRSIHDVVWLTYGPAQMLIVYSVSAAIRTVS
jgi:YhhN family